jgi:amphi-Trp domain-containing protein
MDLMDISEKRQMGREEAAKFLHELADSLGRQNALNLTRDGIKIHVKVPDQVTVELEVEIESDESSIEIEISW